MSERGAEISGSLLSANADDRNAEFHRGELVAPSDGAETMIGLHVRYRQDGYSVRRARVSHPARHRYENAALGQLTNEGVLQFPGSLPGIPSATPVRDPCRCPPRVSPGDDDGALRTVQRFLGY